MSIALVTGATGIVGHSIATALLNAGRPVRAVVRSIEKAKRVLPANIELVEGDVTDPGSIARAVSGCTHVFHAAGLPEQWLADEHTFERVNVEGTRNVATAAKQAGVERFIYTSTIDVFRGERDREFDESVIDPQPKGTAYERSKQKADVLVAELVASAGLPAVFLHPAALYGPAPAGSPGLNDLIVRLRDRQAPMLVPGGMPVVYAPDVARGHLLAAEKGAIGGRYILCERFYEVRELAEMITRALGLKKTPPVMPLWIARIVAGVGETISALIKKPPLLPRGQLYFLQWGARPSSARAQRELGWTPTPFAEGLKTTIEYLKA